MGTILGEPEPEPEPVETWSCWENLMLKTIMEKHTDPLYMSTQEVETGTIDWFHVASRFNGSGDVHIGSYPYMPKVMAWSSKTPLECHSRWNESVKNDSDDLIEQACKLAWKPINVGTAPTLGRFEVEDEADCPGPPDYPGEKAVNELLMASTSGKVSVTDVKYYNTGAEVTVTSQYDTISKQGTNKGCYEGQITFYDCQDRWWDAFEETDVIKFEHSKNRNGIKYAIVYKTSPPRGTGLNVRSRVSFSNDSQSWFLGMKEQYSGTKSLFSTEKLTPDKGIYPGDAGKFRVVLYPEHWSMTGRDDDGTPDEDEEVCPHKFHDPQKVSAAVADITASHPQKSTPTKREITSDDVGGVILFEPKPSSMKKGKKAGPAMITGIGKNGYATLKCAEPDSKGKHTTKLKGGTKVEFIDPEVDHDVRKLFPELDEKYRAKEPEPAPVGAVEDDGIERIGSDVWD